MFPEWTTSSRRSVASVLCASSLLLPGCSSDKEAATPAEFCTIYEAADDAREVILSGYTGAADRAANQDNDADRARIASARAQRAAPDEIADDVRMALKAKGYLLDLADGLVPEPPTPAEITEIDESNERLRVYWAAECPAGTLFQDREEAD